MKAEDLLSKKSLVCQYLSYRKHYLSSYSFVNLFAWVDFFDFEFREIDGNLCIFAQNNVGRFLYFPPLGKVVSLQAVKESFAFMKESRVARIENVGEADLKNFPDTKYRRQPKAYEYCYYKKDLVALKGNLFKSKRSSYNQFVKNHKAKVVSYEPKMLADCLALYKTWKANRTAKYKEEEIFCHMLEENERVHERILKHVRELDLEARVVVVQNKIKAYSVGYALNDQTFCVLFEIADLLLTGLAVYIFREFCADPKLKAYSFINVMDDFEMKQVAQTKLSYNPILLLPSYSVTPKT